MTAGLTLQAGCDADPHLCVARAGLLREVFGADLPVGGGIDGGIGRSFGFFAPDGTCVASLDAFVLPLRLDGTTQDATAIRSVAVAPARRGQGLFRRLMEEALEWCDAAAPGPTLLYTAEPALYTRFGFRPVAQHKRVGAPPDVMPTLPALSGRRLSPGHPPDKAELRRLLAIRAPVSDHVAVCGGASLFLAQADRFTLDHCEALDAVMVLDAEHDFVLVDIVAAVIPPLAALLAASGRCPRRIEVLFPTDKLEWSGTARVGDTGLMARGLLPHAFERPFMLPPTAEF